MGDLHLVLPALNAGISIMMQQVRLMMFSLEMVDYSMPFLTGPLWTFLILYRVYCGTPPSCLKVIGGGVGWWHGGPWDFIISPRPLGFGFWGLGPGLDNYDAPPVQISDWEVTSISKQLWGWGIDHNTDREGILGTWSKLAVSSYMISSKGGTRMIMKWGRIILSQDDNKLLWCGGRRIIYEATVSHYVVNDDFRIWTKVRWKMSMRTISNLEFRGQRLALTHQ